MTPPLCLPSSTVPSSVGSFSAWSNVGATMGEREGVRRFEGAALLRWAWGFERHHYYRRGSCCLYLLIIQGGHRHVAREGGSCAQRAHLRHQEQYVTYITHFPEHKASLVMPVPKSPHAPSCDRRPGEMAPCSDAWRVHMQH